MDNIRLYDKDLTFQRAKASFDYPTVAYIRETDRLYYEPHPKNIVGSVYLHGPYGNVFTKVSNLEKYSPDKGFTPIGVVVIPAFHMEDEKCRVMSLKEMSCDIPDSGATAYHITYWGGYGSDLPSLTNYNVVPYVGSNGTVNNTIQGTTGYASLPSDRFNTVANPYDTDTYYSSSDSSTYYIPSSYNEDDTMNPSYSQTTSPSSALNAMSDFDGETNTKSIISVATAQSDWKTASTITNNSGAGYYPAACCCWRYHTDGTSQGNWYLPACGELGYIMPKFNTIQNTIDKIIEIYGDSIGIQLSNDHYYWSSTEHSSDYGRYLGMSYGVVGSSTKDHLSYVRAFLKV